MERSLEEAGEGELEEDKRIKVAPLSIIRSSGLRKIIFT